MLLAKIILERNEEHLESLMEREYQNDLRRRVIPEKLIVIITVTYNTNKTKVLILIDHYTLPTCINANVRGPDRCVG